MDDDWEDIDIPDFLKDAYFEENFKSDKDIKLAKIKFTMYPGDFAKSVWEYYKKNKKKIDKKPKSADDAEELEDLINSATKLDKESKSQESKSQEAKPLKNSQATTQPENVQQSGSKETSSPKNIGPQPNILERIRNSPMLNGFNNSSDEESVGQNTENQKESPAEEAKRIAALRKGIKPSDLKKSEKPKGDLNHDPRAAMMAAIRGDVPPEEKSQPGKIDPSRIDAFSEQFQGVANTKHEAHSPLASEGRNPSPEEQANIAVDGDKDVPPPPPPPPLPNQRQANIPPPPPLPNQGQAKISTPPTPPPLPKVGQNATPAKQADIARNVIKKVPPTPPPRSSSLPNRGQATTSTPPTPPPLPEPGQNTYNIWEPGGNTPSQINDSKTSHPFKNRRAKAERPTTAGPIIPKPYKNIPPTTNPQDGTTKEFRESYKNIPQSYENIPHPANPQNGITKEFRESYENIKKLLPKEVQKDIDSLIKRKPEKFTPEQAELINNVSKFINAIDNAKKKFAGEGKGSGEQGKQNPKQKLGRQNSPKLTNITNTNRK